MFEQKAGAYAAGRAGYAPEAVDAILAQFENGLPVCAADMGSGTGLLSEALLARGCTVYGVEPDAGMRRKAERALGVHKDFHSVDASAEHTGLPDASVDAVCAASAFHWFDPEKFRSECARILKPGGRVFLLTNAREMDELAQEQARICAQYCEAFISFNHGGEYTDAACARFFAPGYVRLDFRHDLRYTSGNFLARCLSSSYAPAPGSAQYAPYRDALAEWIARRGASGKIAVRNHTVLWHGTL